MKKYILDTNILITDPSIISNKYEDSSIIIPSGVVQELSTTTSYSGSGSLYNSLINNANNFSIIETEKPLIEDWNNEYHNYDLSFIDKSIIAFAEKEKKNNDISIVSNDKKLINKSKELGISTFSLVDFYNNTKKIETNIAIEDQAINIKRYTRKQLFISFILGLLLAIAIFLLFHFFKSIITTINIWLTSVIIICSGPLLYYIRSRKRLLYGITETIIGWFVSFFIIIPDFIISNITTYDVIKIFCGFYIVVRGMDNINKGLIGTNFYEIWKIIFKNQE